MVLASGLSLVMGVASKAAVAHYMLGNVNEAHVIQDLKDAKAVGFDAFALNTGCVSETWVDKSLGFMFNNAAANGMKVYLNMDLYASGDACYNGATCCGVGNDYYDLWNKYKSSDGWYKIDGKNVVGTYSAARWSAVEFTALKKKWGDFYFFPDLDGTEGYYEAAEPWWDHWGTVIDGIASWESSWPKYGNFGGAYPGDVGIDTPQANAAAAHSKEYMIPISPLQYKDAYKTNLYRLGDMNLPVRMENILAMSPRPNYVQFQTWNDGPESHYIGNIWNEQNSDAQPWRYMNPDRYSHKGWQPLVESFNRAFKTAGSTAASMTPPGSKLVVGSMWYQSFPRKTECTGPWGQYSEKPTNLDAGVEGVYFAVVMKAGLPSGYTLKVYSGSTTTPAVYSLKAGLNYGSAEVLNKGAQFLEILDPSGKRVASGSGGMCVAASCPRGIYSRNYHVVSVEEGDAGSTCTPWPAESDEKDPDPAHTSTGVAHTTTTTTAPSTQETTKAPSGDGLNSDCVMFLPQTPPKGFEGLSSCKEFCYKQMGVPVPATEKHTFTCGKQVTADYTDLPGYPGVQTAPGDCSCSMDTLVEIVTTAATIVANVS
ncbi:glycoside hydrolase family 71 protein [Aplosporella prunicola CBS 121167]|uniref:Glycoside hydrolase family 71 protein n=1 Tax=Aplosporella prunicola CBS 121167 TaxID=1176127 RepID=A0A6A6AZ29_9PEZI|nr:glycoside hydrolase family 71 protein [Aplosporella prunicola CBS 121167]KAF2137040.1 glycoside hydrolase family 71 protein [Aplosporella prunicola CBS 121167]